MGTLGQQQTTLSEPHFSQLERKESFGTHSLLIHLNLLLSVTLSTKLRGWGIQTSRKENTPIQRIIRNKTQTMIKSSLCYQSNCVKGKQFNSYFAVLFAINDAKQACLKLCYSEDLQRRNILSLYNLIYIEDKQQ